MSSYPRPNRARLGGVEQRIRRIKSALSLTTDPGVVLPTKLRVSTLVAQLRPVLVAVAHYGA